LSVIISLGGRTCPIDGLDRAGRGAGRFPPVAAPDREPRLADLLARIREEASASYRHFGTSAELGRLVRDDLAVLLSERFAAAGGRAPAVAPSPPGARGPGRLLVSTTSLVGRERAIGEVADLLGQPGARLVTLTGPGGVGKTRLAVAVGERLRDRFGAGTVFVPLDAVTDPGLVLAAIGRAAGADLARTGSPVEAASRARAKSAGSTTTRGLGIDFHLNLDLVAGHDTGSFPVGVAEAEQVAAPHDGHPALP
jgi:hypothetical protein